MPKDILPTNYNEFLKELKLRVSNSRLKAARSVNTELLLLYHYIGTEIVNRMKNDGWGSKVIERLSRDLKIAFPEMKGFSPRNLGYMRKFAEEYQNVTILQEVLAKLTWYHHQTLLDKITDKQTRLFYINKAIDHDWSRNIMLMHIEMALHKREGKAITNFKDKLPAPQSDLAHYTLKDPYIFDFLSIGEKAHEREVENALINHIEKFLLELGAGFAFLGRQYHLSVGDDDFYIDMLFYNLKLRAYFIVELKSGKYKPEYAGKLNFYLSAVDQVLKTEHYNPSIGLILCKSKNDIVAEYSLKDVNKPIGLAAYSLIDHLPKELQTALPTIEELEAELAKDLDNE